MEVLVDTSLVKSIGAERAIMIEWLMSYKIYSIKERIKDKDFTFNEIDEAVNDTIIELPTREMSNNPIDAIEGACILEAMRRENLLDINVDLISTIIFSLGI